MQQFDGTPNVFITNCVGALGEDINEMKDMALENIIDFDEFMKTYSAGDDNLVKDLAESMGYESPEQMDNDFHLSYHMSYYRGEPCLYLVHSGIEHVYMTPTSALKVSEYGSGEERQAIIDDLTDALDEYEPLENAKTEGQAISALADFYREHKEDMDENNILLSSLAQWSHPDSKAFVKVDEAIILGQENDLNDDMSP